MVLVNYAIMLDTLTGVRLSYSSHSLLTEEPAQVSDGCHHART